MMAACGGKTEKVPFDNGDSADVANADPTIYGVCAEGTAMNTLQLITDMGDTLSIDISTAQENNKVFGGMHVGDRMAVVPNSGKDTALMVVNQATLHTLLFPYQMETHLLFSFLSVTIILF